MEPLERQSRNLLLLSQITALAESFAVGRSGGLSDDQLRELLGSSVMVAPAVKRLYDEAAASGLDHADVAAVTELYRRPATSVP